MTLECRVCGERSDAGPTHNPNLIKWICVHCIHTPAAKRLMDQLEYDEQ